jgi:hypothetical protein
MSQLKAQALGEVPISQPLSDCEAGLRRSPGIFAAPLCQIALGKKQVNAAELTLTKRLPAQPEQDLNGLASSLLSALPSEFARFAKTAVYIFAQPLGDALGCAAGDRAAWLEITGPKQLCNLHLQSFCKSLECSK